MWTGAETANSAPVGGAIRSTMKPDRVRPGYQFSIEADITEPDGDPVRIEWRVIPETTDRRSGGDAERAPQAIPDRLISASANSAVIEAPVQPGAYRIFVFAYDDAGGVGTANLPFQVLESE